MTITYYCQTCHVTSKVNEPIYRGKEPDNTIPIGRFTELALELDYWNYYITCPICYTKHVFYSPKLAA